MSPSPPFPSPLPHSHSSSARPGIIGEHRAQPIQQHAAEPPNGEYLLHLLQAGKQVQQQQQHSIVGNGGGAGGGRGGGYEQQQQQHSSHYSFAMPGIVTGGGDIPMAAWDPAVAALGPSHSYSHNGMVGGAVVGDGRDFLPGLYPSSQFHNVPMVSGWPTHQALPPPQQQHHHHHHQHLHHPFTSPTLSAASSSISSSLSPPVDLRLLQGRTRGHPLVPIPGALPSSLYGSHVEMLQRRSAEWHPTLQQQQQQQLRGMLTESDISPNLSANNMHGRGSLPPERGPHQQFFGDGAELMKLLQISSSKGAPGTADPKAVDKQTGAGGSVSAGPKVSPAIVHGPIGPPKRNESSSSRSSPADDLLGRFWPAPPTSISNGLEDHNPKPPGFAFKENPANLGAKERVWWGEQHPGEKKLEILVGRESGLHPSFANRDGGARFGLPTRLFPLGKGGGGLPENLEYHEGRGLLGGWGGDFFDEVAIDEVGIAGGGHQYRKSSTGGRNRDELYVKTVEQQAVNLNSHHHEQQQHVEGPSSKELMDSEHSRDSNGRMEGTRGGGVGGRRGPAGSRGEIGGRRGGRTVIGQWVAVNERQREREGLEMSGPSDGGAESGSEKGSNSTGNSCKEEAIGFPKEGSGSQKVRDDLKRRRGQQQEWRMKTPPTHAQIQAQAQSSLPKMSDFSSGSESPELINGNYRISSPLKIPPLAAQVDHPGLPSNIVQDSPGLPGSAIEESKKIYHDRTSYEANGNEDGLGKDDEEELVDAFIGYMEVVMDEPDMGHRQAIGFTPAQEEVDYETRQEHMREFRRHPHRTLAIPSLKPEMRYRPDLEKFTAQMLAMYLSLIPTEEEERKRRQFLSHLDQLVSREWPGALLFLFGSCANAFGVCNSDIDVCLSINDDQLSKADLVLKMAAILRSDNMQNVQALTHARVPIVKFTDASTGISCDICVNNMLAVVNSKLLHDYSQIDVRLRQLAFLVKHWAKRRQVNETYRGTLSSYAYVLMCIHFLQQRKPAILPCLQEMRSTYRVTVGNIDCAYYDQVETLQNFGIANKETLGELLTSFFEYWAFRHDYNRAVISVRTGGYLSKDEKEWTRRIGNERHLICIEDPLEIVHDLGRVVDRHSIRVLRDEFHRAAKILRHDLNPCTTLFEPFVREKP